MALVVLEVSSRKPPKMIRIPKRMAVQYSQPLHVAVKASMKLPKEIAEWIMHDKRYALHFRTVNIIEEKPTQVIFVDPPIEPFTGDRININAAGKDELKALGFLTPYMITAILNYRKDKIFLNVNELLQVPGIGERTMQKLAQAVFVEQL